MGAVGERLPQDEQKLLDEACVENLENAKLDPSVKKFLEKMDKAKCPYSPGCKCCQGTGLDKAHGRKIKGAFNNDASGTIIICSDRNKSLPEVIDTLTQELVHAAQNCSDIDSGIAKQKNKCDTAICHELQGYASMPQNSAIESNIVKARIMQGAASSAMNHCQGKTFNELMNRASQLFEQCA